jgi:diguanylate cyclase (GGDEF)-like protein
VVKRTAVIFTGDQQRELHHLKSSLLSRDYGPIYLGGAESVIERVGILGSGIVIVSDNRTENSMATARLVRSRLFDLPIQVVVIGEPDGGPQIAIDSGIDDILTRPVNGREFGFRLRASFMRLRVQLRLIEERDFFRNAARQEEELSSRILDQHMILKQAFANIEDLNKELEETNDRLEQIARFDTLSGLLNRRSLFSTIDIEIERTTRTAMTLSGIMLDVDNFKEINDEHGHLSGDQAIAEVGGRLAAHLRKYDQAGRYGGEEFFVILPNAKLQQAYIIAERFRLDLARSPALIEDRSIQITASFGIAEYQPGEGREAWIARADRNMYVAKEGGRNRVVAE